jgi:hypothetical protein
MDNNPFAPQHPDHQSHHQPHHQGQHHQEHQQHPQHQQAQPAFEQPYSPAPAEFTPPVPAAPAWPNPQPAAQNDWQQPSTALFTPQPPQPPAAPVQSSQPGITPQPVVFVLSPRGVEYVFLTIALITSAIGLISALLSLVNGETGFDVLAFPVALMLVGVPVFAALFLRLKNAELTNPSLALDASKRRSTQFIQISSFLVCFFTLIGFVTSIFAKISGNLDSSIFKVFLDVLVISVVAGGILAYYWRDEHRS